MEILLNFVQAWLILLQEKTIGLLIYYIKTSFALGPAKNMCKVNQLSPILMSFLFAAIVLQTSCAKPTAEVAPKPVDWNGTCSNSYREDYLDLLNLDSNNAELRSKCDLFYQKYDDVKCMAEVESVEVRVHTADFDLKCSRGDFKNYEDPKKKKDKDKNSNNDQYDDESENYIPKCSNQIINYLQKTEAIFEVNKSIITNTKSNDIVFTKALDSYRTCNQFFHVYKYSACRGADQDKFSYLNLKPFCSFFRNKLETLNKKYPGKYFPEEFLPLTKLKLRMKINDPYISFYSTTALAKTIIVAGKSMTATKENKTANYCVFTSKSLKTSAKVSGIEVKILEIDKENDTSWNLSASINNNSFNIICRSARQIFLQDLKEILGNKAHFYSE